MADLVKIFTEPYLLIIKGFKGEPACLEAKNIKNNFVTVAGKSGTTQMTLKSKYAFCYDENLYKRLKNAYENNDKEGLEKLWQQAKPITTFS
jgi:hypothetical protein